MTVNLSVVGGAGWQFFDNNGVMLSGGLLWTYAAGTTTPLTTYTDITGATPNANPIVLDSTGRIPGEVWLTAAAYYKFVLQTSVGVQIWSSDNISGNTADISTITLTATGGSTARTTVSHFSDILNWKDFGAAGDGATNDRAAIVAMDALGYNTAINGTYRISSNLTIANNVTFGPNASITVDGGVTVTFSGEVIAPPKQQIFSGSGVVVLSRRTVQAFPEWWGASAASSVNGAAMNKMVAACSANYVPVYFDGPYNIETLVTLSPGIPVDCSADCVFTAIGGAAYGIRVTSGTGARMRLPSVTGFSVYGINLSGTSYGQFEVKNITTNGTGVLVDTVNASYAVALQCTLKILLANGNTSNDVCFSADNAANAMTGWEVFIETSINGKNVFTCNATSISPNFFGNRFTVNNALPTIAGGSILTSNLAILDSCEVNVPGSLNGITGSLFMIGTSGVINNMKARLRLSQNIRYTDVYYGITGTGNRTELTGDTGTQNAAIEGSNTANNRVGFNGGNPVNRSNRMYIQHTVTSAPLANGASETFYVYHPLADQSMALQIFPLLLKGMIVDSFYFTGVQSEIVITLRNASGSTIANGTVITMFVSAGWY